MAGVTSDAAKATGKQLRSLEEVNSAIQIQTQLQGKLAQAMDDATDIQRQVKLQKEYEKTQKTLENLFKEQEKLGGAEGGGGGDFGGGGGAMQALQGLSGRLGGMGDGGAKIAEITSGIADFSDSIGSLKEGFQDIGSKAQGLIKTFKQTKSETGDAGSAILSMVTKGITPAGAAALAAEVAMMAVTAAVNYFANEAEKAGQKALTAAQNYKKEIDARREVQDFEKTGDYTGFTQNLDDLKTQSQDISDYIAYLEGEIKDIDEQYAELGGSLNVGARSQLGDQGKKLREELETYYRELGDVNTKITQFVPAAQTIKDAEEALRAAERLKEAETELIDVRTQAADIQKNLETSLAEQEQERQFQRSRELEDRQLEDMENLKSYLDEQQQAQDDAQQELVESDQNYRQSMIDAQEDFNEQSLAAQKDFDRQRFLAKRELDREFKRADEEYSYERGKALEEYNKSVTETQQQFMQDSISAVEDYNEQILDAEEDLADERERIVRDMLDSMLEAEQANDVIAFVRAKKEGEKQLGELQERGQEQKDAATEAFLEQQQAAQENYDKQLEDQRAAFQEQEAAAKEAFDRQRAQRLEEFAISEADAKEEFELAKAQRAEEFQAQQEEAKKAHAAELAQIRAQLAETLQANEAAFQAEETAKEEQRARADARAEEDAQRAIDAQEKAAQDQLAALKKKEDDLLVVVRSKGQESVAAVTLAQTQIVAEYQRGAAAAAAAVKSQMNFKTPTNSSSSNTQNGTQSKPVSTAAKAQPQAKTNKLLAFAKGGIVDRPTRGVIGDGLKPGWAEAAIPFQKSEGIDAALRRIGGTGGSGGGGAPILFNPQFNVTVGDIASRAEVEAALEAYNTALWAAHNQAIAKARAASA